jgi:uncharacterized protein
MKVPQLAQQLSHWCTMLLTSAIRLYRLAIRPWLGLCCRFEPTCSAYALEVLKIYGPWQGTYLIVRRLLRCHPWYPGGNDPVPKKSG